MKPKSAIAVMAMMAAAYSGRAVDSPIKLTPEEIEARRKYGEFKKMQRKLKQGLNMYEINGHTFWARTEGGALRKYNNYIKKQKS